MMQTVFFIQMEALINNGIPAEGAEFFLKTLEEKGMSYVILSELCSRTRDHLSDYCIERGFRYMRPGYFYTGSMAAVDYLSSHDPQHKKCVYVGGEGLKEALQIGGFGIDYQEPDYLFVGMDKSMNYEDYNRLLQNLNDGASLICLDERRTQELEGETQIGNASIVKMLEYASNKEALHFGRGTKSLVLQAMRFMHVTYDQVTFVGVDFKKDILPALDMHLRTVLVTRGESIENTGIDAENHPDYIVDTLMGLTK